VQDLVVVVRIFSGIKAAIESNHWTHSGSPAYYHLIRKLDMSDDFKLKLYFLAPSVINNNIKKKVYFDNLNTAAKFIPYYPLPFSRHSSTLKRVEFFYNKIRQYLVIIIETRNFKYFYIDRDNILLTFMLLIMFRSNMVVTRLLGVTEGLYKHLVVRNNILSKIIRWTFNSNRSYFICTNDGSYAELTKKNLDNDRFYLLFNGVDKPPTSLRDSRGNGEFKNKIVISYISRIVENKGHINFINSINNIENKKLIIYIIGDGNLRKQCEELVGKYKLNDIVFFKGNVAHKDAMIYLANSDIFVYINYDGSFGNGVLEASQLGLPIVTLSHKSFSSKKYPFFKYIENNDRIEENLSLFLKEFIFNESLGQLMSKNSAEFSDRFLISWNDRIDEEIKIINSIFI
jgi:glycosyltransferase involved in cell wall biosynthesis